MPRKILIIEDSQTVSHTLKDMLSREGFFVDMVVSGEEGITRVESECPDLVIIDTVLPGINGFEVCKKIRAGASTNFPKILIITGTIDAGDAVKAREVGADDYCAKTTDLGELGRTAKALLAEE